MAQKVRSKKALRKLELEGKKQQLVNDSHSQIRSFIGKSIDELRIPSHHNISTYLEDASSSLKVISEQQIYTGRTGRQGRYDSRILKEMLEKFKSITTPVGMFCLEGTLG